MPETKNVSLEELEQRLSPGGAKSPGNDLKL